MLICLAFTPRPAAGTTVDNSSPAPMDTNAAQRGGDLHSQQVCYQCQQPGHIAWDCPTGFNAQSRYTICAALEDFLGLDMEDKEDGISAQKASERGWDFDFRSEKFAHPQKSS